MAEASGGLEGQSRNGSRLERLGLSREGFVSGVWKEQGTQRGV